MATSKSGSKKAAAKKGGNKTSAKKSSGSKTSKRTLVEPHKGDKRYVRRDKEGQFKKVVDVGRSLAADQRNDAKTKVKKGQGDRGDVAR